MRPAEIAPLATTTLAIRVTKHDAYGVPSKPALIRDRTAVQDLLAALGADAQPAVPCPPDYAAAEVGLLLTGSDVYARRNAYVWDLAAAPRVVVVHSTGCRGGAVRDAGLLRRVLGAEFATTAAPDAAL